MEEGRRRPKHLTGRLGRQEVAGCLMGAVAPTGAPTAARVAAPLLHPAGLWGHRQTGAVDVGQGIALSGAVCDRGGW